MYDELVKRLNAYSAEHENHGGITAEAADAIEDLEFACNRYEKDYKALCAYLPKWIPVTERLPELNANVLVYSAHSGLIRIDANIWFDRNATHWMPLPEPPEEET